MLVNNLKIQSTMRHTRISFISEHIRNHVINMKQRAGKITAAVNSLSGKTVMRRKLLSLNRTWPSLSDLNCHILGILRLLLAHSNVNSLPANIGQLEVTLQELNLDVLKTTFSGSDSFHAGWMSSMLHS